MGANKRLRQCSQGRRWESALSLKLRSRVKRTGPNRSRATGEFMDQKKPRAKPFTGVRRNGVRPTNLPAGC